MSVVFAAAVAATVLPHALDLRRATPVVAIVLWLTSLLARAASVVLAAAGIARPRVLVSAGALVELDDDELAAGLEHEQGHIARRHRWLLLTGTLARAIGRPIPGATTALAELRFHLERDADRWALSRLDDRLALASVICKAATTAIPAAAATPLGGSNVVARVRELTDDPTGPSRSPWRTFARPAAVFAAAAAIAIASPVPGAVAQPQASDEIRHCPS